MLSFWRNRAIRNVIMQAAVLGATFAVLGYATYNAAINLKASGIASGFGFMFEKAGYDINFSLIDYSPKTATHLYAWLVGTLNTVFFSILTIVSTTVLALGLAIARLSPNWLLSNVSRAIVEYVRNVPVLVHIFIWYGIYLTLPPIRQSINLSDVAFLSNRGLFLPAFPWRYDGATTLAFLVALGIGVAVVVRSLRDASRLSRWSVSLAVAIAIAVVATLVAGAPPFGIEVPVKRGFNFHGGVVLPPELLVIWTAVTVYFSAHCAEVIRGGVIAVPKGQAEAARALGARRSQVLMEIVIPQALRAIVPPMTSNYINILKAAALGTAIGFIDVMGATGGSTLNITGQAIECIMIVMVTYMILNLILSAIMARVNRLVQIKER